MQTVSLVASVDLSNDSAQWRLNDYMICAGCAKEVASTGLGRVRLKHLPQNVPYTSAWSHCRSGGGEAATAEYAWGVQYT